MKTHYVGTEKKFSVKMLQRLPFMTDKQMEKVHKFDSADYEYRLDINDRYSYWLSSAKFQQMIDEGWLEIIEEKERKVFVVAGHEVKFNKKSIGIGCQNVKNIHLLFLALQILAREQGNKFEVTDLYVTDKVPTRFGTYTESSTLAKVIKTKVRVIRAMPGLRPDAELSLSHDGSFHLNSPTYGNIRYSDREVRELIKNGWFEKKEESSTVEMFVGSEKVKFLTGMTEINGNRIPNQIILDIASKVADSIDTEKADKSTLKLVKQLKGSFGENAEKA